MMTIYIVNTYNRYQEEVRGGHSVEVAGILLHKSLCVQHTHHKSTGTDLCPPKMDIFILISILPQTNIVSHETPSLLSKLYSQMFFKMCLLTGCYVHYTAWHNIYKLYAIGGMWLKRSFQRTNPRILFF